jgi:outer membrane protein assembly factor BamB
LTILLLAVAPSAAWTGTSPAGASPARAVPRTTPTPTPTDQTPYDWTTYGFDGARTGFNPLETELTSENVPSLHVGWTFDLGGVAIDQPLYAAGVMVSGTPTDLVYIGAEDGKMYALNAETGHLVWSSATGTRTTTCTGDMQGGTFGITSTGVIDRSSNRIYFVGKSGQIYARDLSTGASVTGWPLTVVTNPNTEYAWSALTMRGGNLYVAIAAYCDEINPYYGHVSEVSIATHSIVHAWFVNGRTGAGGGGIYGYGGVSVDEAGNVYAATDNSLGSSEHNGLSEQTVRLSAALSVGQHSFTELGATDEGQGTTPMLYEVPGSPANCPSPQLAVENKAGVLLVFNSGSISSGPVQKLRIAPADTRFNERLQGVTAFSPETGLVYLFDPHTLTPYKRGLLALRPDTTKPNCPLQLAWNAASTATSGAGSDPTVAGDVVYWGDGFGKTVHANDAVTGAPLWNSGSLGGLVFSSPMVANDRLFVATWNGTSPSSSHFYEFEPAPVPTITGFSPTSGHVGDTVTITGTSFTGASQVSFNGVAATTFTVDSDTQISAVVPTGATTGPISVTAPGGTATSNSSFTVLEDPIVDTQPTAKAVGDPVIVTGSHFTGATSVTFNGVAASFTVDSDTQITTAVPDGALTGPLVVTTDAGSGSAPFKVLPTITSFAPTAGPVGTTVVLTGSAFSDATDVRFGKVEATFTIDSYSQITTSVPAGAVSAKIAVVSPGGIGRTAKRFRVR